MGQNRRLDIVVSFTNLLRRWALTKHRAQVQEHDEQVDIVSGWLYRRHDEEVTMMFAVSAIEGRERKMKAGGRSEGTGATVFRRSGLQLAHYQIPGKTIR